MRRLLLLILGVLVAWLGIAIPTAGAADLTARSESVHAHTYDVQLSSAPAANAIPERGPPSWEDLHNTYDAESRRARSREALPQRARSVDMEFAVSKRAFVAANTAIRVRPPLSIPKSQFGTKWGKHASDYGLDAGDSAARAAWKSRIRDVHLNPDEVRLGQHGVYDEAFMFSQGEDLLITRTDGTFVSMYPGGSTSSWFKGAEVFPH